MFNNLFFSISQRSQNLFEQWKYLLLQEKCRICQRLIHPLIDKMDFVAYAPPANYLIGHKQIISDAICQFCLPKLTSYRAVLTKHHFKLYQPTFANNDELLVASGAIFIEPIQSLIHRFKYNEDVLLAKDMTYFLYQAWQLLIDEIFREYNLEDACLVPVPLHKKRLHERGFNQAEILADHMSHFLTLKVEKKSVNRIRNTKSQQKLSKIERAKNMVGAFRSKNDNAFEGKVIFLVDDVCTSSATLIECAKAIFAGGAQAVYALTIAFVP